MVVPNFGKLVLSRSGAKFWQAVLASLFRQVCFGKFVSASLFWKAVSVCARWLA
jgi:hypothetical protein